ncbi:MAG: sulfatase/phosphatase domain-containing protein [Planctomycetota bacterium]
MPIASSGIQSAVSNVCDLLPTIADVTGISLPPDHPLDGESLATLLSGKKDHSRDGVFVMHFPHEHRTNYFSVLRAGKYKLAYHYFPGEDSGDKRYQLFDLESDPFEQNDLAEHNPAMLSNLLVKLRTELDHYGAQFPVGESGPIQIELNRSP